MVNKRNIFVKLACIFGMNYYIDLIIRSTSHVFFFKQNDPILNTLNTSDRGFTYF